MVQSPILIMCNYQQVISPRISWTWRAFFCFILLRCQSLHVQRHGGTQERCQLDKGTKKMFSLLFPYKLNLNELYTPSSWTHSMKQQSWIRAKMKTTEASTTWGCPQCCVCIGINIHICTLMATEYNSERSHTFRKGRWQSSGRESGWITQTHKYRWLNTPTHTLVSAGFGPFSSVLFSQQKDHKYVYETSWRRRQCCTVIRENNTHTLQSHRLTWTRTELNIGS